MILFNKDKKLLYGYLGGSYNCGSNSKGCDIGYNFCDYFTPFENIFKMFPQLQDHFGQRVFATEKPSNILSNIPSNTPSNKPSNKPSHAPTSMCYKCVV